MNEIQDLNGDEAAWGIVAKLMDKISDREEAMGGWDELINMIAETYANASAETDSYKIFFNLHQFFFRLYYRIKAFDSPQPFNSVNKTTIGRENYYRISNYDYKMFLYAMNNGYMEHLDNLSFLIPESKLDAATKKKLEARANQ